jgi:hypothetical protein
MERRRLRIKRISPRSVTTFLAAGGAVLVTIHPSYLLRIHNDASEAEKAETYRQFVQDLRVGAKALHVVG